MTTEIEKAVNYYKAGMMQNMKGIRGDVRPDWIPSKIEIVKTVRSEGFGPRLIAKPGIYQAYSNQFGAVSVRIKGNTLGVKPNEFDVVEWVENYHKVAESIQEQK